MKRYLLNKIRKTLASLRSPGRRISLYAVTAAAIVIAASMVCVKLAAYSQDVNSGLSSHLVRLHVVANSDSFEDQELKRKVRDTVLEYMEGILEDARDIDETNRLLAKSIKGIEAMAQEQLRVSGKDYGVKAVLGKFAFPTKRYGDVALPAGYYKALRIVLGKGEGANWWCVLFPPLCFVDASHGTVPESVKEDLREALTNEEYNIVVSADDNGQIPVRVRFKIVEFFQEPQKGFGSIFRNLFGLR